MKRRNFLACCAVLVWWPVLAAPAFAAQPALGRADRAAIRDVISRQLAAFQADDGELAFSFASEGIRRQIGSAERFLEMVRTSYEPLYRPRAIEFLDARQTHGTIIQPVRATGPDGRVFVAFYAMQRVAAKRGSKRVVWKIDGCQLAETQSRQI